MRKREACRTQAVADALFKLFIRPPWWEEGCDALGCGNEIAKALLGSRSPTLDAPLHSVDTEDTLIFLAHAKRVDEDLEGLLFSAIVPRKLSVNDIVETGSEMHTHMNVPL